MSGEWQADTQIWGHASERMPGKLSLFQYSKADIRNKIDKC